jgi:Domain of unknown function (DUF929)
VLNSDPEGPDIIGTSPDFLDGARNTLKARISRYRRPLITVVSVAVVAAVAVVAIFAAIRPAAPAPKISPALAKLIREVTTVPENAEISTNVDFLGILAHPVAGTPLTQHGKPEVFYVDAGFCPYCAAQNWALIVALSHFGTFSGLSTVRTHLYDGSPPIDGWMFYGSSFTSRYLAFVPVEAWSDTLVSAKANPDDRNSYRRLQKLTQAQQAVFDKYDATHAVPFIDFGNQSVSIGSILPPTVLAGQTWSQIAATLSDGRTVADQAILSAAASLTGQLCQLTGNRPASACPVAITSIQAGN